MLHKPAKQVAIPGKTALMPTFFANLKTVQLGSFGAGKAVNWKHGSDRPKINNAVIRAKFERKGGGFPAQVGKKSTWQFVHHEPSESQRMLKTWKTWSFFQMPQKGNYIPQGSFCFPLASAGHIRCFPTAQTEEATPRKRCICLIWRLHLLPFNPLERKSIYNRLFARFRGLKLSLRTLCDHVHEQHCKKMLKYVWIIAIIINR